MIDKATDKELVATFDLLQKLHKAKEETAGEPLALSEFHFLVLQVGLKRKLITVT